MCDVFIFAVFFIMWVTVVNPVRSRPESRFASAFTTRRVERPWTSIISSSAGYGARRVLETGSRWSSVSAPWSTSSSDARSMPDRTASGPSVRPVSSTVVDALRCQRRRDALAVGRVSHHPSRHVFVGEKVDTVAESIGGEISVELTIVPTGTFERHPNEG